MSSARYVLGVVTLLNFVNYIDRFILAAVLPRVKADFALTDSSLAYSPTRFSSRISSRRRRSDGLAIADRARA